MDMVEDLLLTPDHPLHPMHERAISLENKKYYTRLSFRCVESAFLACCFNQLEMQRRFQNLDGFAARDVFKQMTETTTYGLRDDLLSLTTGGLTGQAVILQRLSRVKFRDSADFRAALSGQYMGMYRLEYNKKTLTAWGTDMWWLYCLQALRTMVRRPTA